MDWAENTIYNDNQGVDFNKLNEQRKAEKAAESRESETRDWVRDNDRDAVIKRIREGLKRRSLYRKGEKWSVTGGRGTAWGWITITIRRKNECMTDAERARLAELLGLPEPCHFQGKSIPAGSDYYAEYIDRAEGREPSVKGRPYWD